jgi:hypothetical protein
VAVRGRPLPHVLGVASGKTKANAASDGRYVGSMAPRRNEQCPCGSGLKYKRCCLDADRRRERLASATAAAWSGEAPEPEGEEREMTLIVETPAGMLVRRIPNAMGLRSDVERGEAAEEAVHDSAAIWGLPDFIYRGRIVAVGSGAREVGDNLIVVGDVGVVVQVKSRAAPSDDVQRERRWIQKNVQTALDQARGSIRRLQSGPIELTNGRGRTIEVDGSKLRWLSTVVIDHPSPPDEVPVLPYDPTAPAVVLLRRDWDFLFEQLKSTHAVVGYLERVVADPIALGEEPVRYHQLALADHEAEPSGIDPALVGGGRTVSAPLLPLAAHPGDWRPHLLVRSIFEDIAITPAPEVDEANRLTVLAELDRLPVSHRAQIGRFLEDGLAKTAEAEDDETVWRFRRFVGGLDRVHLAFGVCSQFSQMHHDLFGWWVQLRHYEHCQVRGDNDVTTVGVLLTPRHDGVRAFDTTMITVRGELQFSEEELQALRQAWPDQERVS